VGLFSLALQDMFTRVVAVDSDKSSCRDAENNIQRDEHARGTIVLKQGAMDLVVTDPTLADAEAWATGVCIVDPPRAGLGKEGVKALLALRPAHIVSLSCDPATLARDTTALVAAGYVLRKLKVMDFFPQTAHIECLLLLERQD
jgi:23S rRNA (uracil1939-C5)-methyltransferase